MWGVIYKDHLIQYGAGEETIALEGTSFYLYTNLDEAIDARDKIAGPFKMVVVPIDKIKFVENEMDY